MPRGDLLHIPESVRPTRGAPEEGLLLPAHRQRREHQGGHVRDGGRDAGTEGSDPPAGGAGIARGSTIRAADHRFPHGGEIPAVGRQKVGQHRLGAPAGGAANPQHENPLGVVAIRPGRPLPRLMPAVGTLAVRAPGRLQHGIPPVVEGGQILLHRTAHECYNNRV